MYQHTILGKELKISNKAYEALVRKWRVGNIEESRGEWVVQGKCVYCSKYFNDVHCKGCPFDVFSVRDSNPVPEELGCQELAEYIYGEYVSLNFSYADFKTKESAIACVSAVKKELKKFKKI